ncbi:glyceraldehyde-3-phosphate dehydrogenase [Glutamicibacter protophormiae]|uniref:Glyceraldehyde-3-phosphate dehydrogenase n=1 Tax=Glutamicibacter protophormiae TaxID=37930 RepID=A0ABS4XSP1_GLUPR|nr:glyceraldehyde-3-phosphate dehydrogenase [Glutamicibacter protophormiae]MBP2399539.1 glyceraldehyde 3-phosphate dehydrogenase [Glutamicibacter protophormiae]QRQ80122.1 glyceraldehyde-3-phosphate dehydrogenase [Glutamicibacter protophormiae]GGL84056.1 glyceraldehyde-3-phosphate dehydrogenase [Glutamicibacter protophormiae]
MTQQSVVAQEEWSGREELAEAMIPLIGRLYRKNNVVTSIYGRKLINQSAIDIIKAHRVVRRIDGEELDLNATKAILDVIETLNVGSVSVDLGRLNKKFVESGSADLNDFVSAELGAKVGQAGATDAEPTDVVLYGFGRIGRLLARILIERGGYGLRLRAIVVRKGSDDDIVKRASLLRRDSVHGKFDGTITVDEENNTILANGTLIQVIYSNDPATIDYTAYGIDNAIVVDNTGRWRDEAGLSQHLQSKGVSRVLLTAPGKGNLKNIVHGINDSDITADDKIVSAASCTTNAITPVLKALNDKFGVIHGHVETVHSFTNDQNLIDNFHKGERRGRSAVLNMVITETGAAKAVSKALPELEGKLTGNAIRVPTPDVSMAILNLNLETATDKDELNNYLRETSLGAELHKQIDYIDSPEVVSTDFVGSRRAGIVDGLATIATGKNAVVYVWYDNEFGYSCQVVRVIETMAGTHPVAVPAVKAEAVNA